MRPNDGLRWRQCREQPGYYEAFTKSPPTPVEPISPPPNVGTCGRRGTRLGDFRCDSCGTPTRPVYRCPTHKRCADIGSTGVVSCLVCPDHTGRSVPAGPQPVDAFERVYCVNLDRRPDRWRRFAENAMAVEGWPLPEVRRFTATDGRQPDTPGWWNAGGGAWGCRDSHVRILRECIRDGVESVLIFEDDAKFEPSFAERLRAFLAAVPPWECVFLGGQHHDRRPKVVAPGVIRSRSVTRTHGYALRGEGIRKVLAHMEDLEDWSRRPKSHIDHRFAGMMSRGELTAYCPDRWLVIQGENTSDIDGGTHGDRSWHPTPPFRPTYHVPDDGRIRVGAYYPWRCLGGAETWLADLMRYLDPSRFVAAGIAVEREGDPPLVEMPCPVTTDHRTVAHNSDVVLAWGVSTIGPLRSHYSGPVVCVSQGDVEFEHRHVRPIAALSTAYAAVSRNAVAAFPRAYRKRVRVIRNGIDLSRLTPTAERAELRRRLGIPDEATAVGFVGRLSPEKDPLAVARAVAAMPEGFAVYCGPDRSGDFEPQVRSLCGDRLAWLGTRRDVGDVLRALDVYVLSSPSEGCSLALCEAWCAGVPTVVSETGIVPDFPGCAEIVPTGADGATLAAAIRRATSGAGRRQAARVREWAREEFAAERMAAEWGAFLAAVVAKAGAA